MCPPKIPQKAQPESSARYGSAPEPAPSLLGLTPIQERLWSVITGEARGVLRYALVPSSSEYSKYYY